MTVRKIVTRETLTSGFPSVLSPVVRRVFGNRGAKPNEIDYALTNALPGSGLLGIHDACRVIADAIEAGRRLSAIADFDCDGAHSAAVFIRGLRMMGVENVGFCVPNRVKLGYGISPGLVDMAIEDKGELLVTLDNGIVGYEGIDYATARGCQVVVIDHHAAGKHAPNAAAIVNPHQPGCEFKSKTLAAVGVAFYVLNGLKRELVSRGHTRAADAPLNRLLPYVAIGTVGDLVPLDYNNRILVQSGLRMIRANGCDVGLAALMRVGGVDPNQISVTDIGFKLANRVNAVGRMDDMRLGISLLTTDDPEEADTLARTLDSFNSQRKRKEADMREDALALVENNTDTGITLFSEDNHEGIVGLIASRVKDAKWRPTVVFANAADGLLKGSGRSIPSLHIRDAFAEIDAAHPGLLKRWGGHGQALGCSIRKEDLSVLAQAFDAICKAKLTAKDLDNVIETDGVLHPDEITVGTALALERAGPFGQGFPEPIFEGAFKVQSVKTMGSEGQHVRYTVRVGDETASLVDFGGAERIVPEGSEIGVAYRMAVNRWKGRESLDLQAVEIM